MRRIIMMCMILSVELVCQGQENSENNRSSKSSDNERGFGVAVDASGVPAFTRSPVTLSPTWSIDVPKEEKVGHSRGDSNDDLIDATRNQRNKRRIAGAAVDYRQPVLPESQMEPATVNVASGQALNEFMNSRTSEESRIALENYMNLLEGPKSNPNKESQMTMDYSQRRNNGHMPIFSGGVPSRVGIHNSPSDYYNALGQQRQPVRYRGHRHRVPMNSGLGGRPWLAQSRIDSRPLALYRDKGPLAPSPAAAAAHRRHYAEKWESHPSSRLIHRPPPNNSPFPYQEAINSHWSPDPSDSGPPPPQNDVYYSQLYAQSYDPHYYNYIAKTGKIKPWLYGKLGKHEEKSIWWELFNSFKKHGMKNMMNPVFLLGMTIPTLTIMLTALVQKRSLGRTNPDGSLYINEKLIEEYAEKIQRAIECYEKRIEKDKDNNECW